jgi:hypothetical protein
MSFPWRLSPGDQLEGWRLVSRLDCRPERVTFKVERGGRTFLLAFPLPRGPETLPEEALATADGEARCLERLDTPRVARLVERGTWPGEAGGFPFLVKEYVKGVPLPRWSREEPAPAHVLRVFRGVMETLYGMYARGLRCPGLRSEDLWVRAEVLEPVFVDLSGAWAQPGRVSAPDRVGDMRALGAVLYEMLTCQKPHGNPPVAPHLLKRGVLQDLSELALAMLETPEDPVH